MLQNRALGTLAPVTNKGVFADLYQTHTHAIFNYCLFRVADRNVAADLTADTFERAWRARHRYNPERALFGTWLFTIAQRVVTDWQRRQLRRFRFQLFSRQARTMPSAESQVEESEQQAHLRRLVKSLPLHQQELVALKFGAEMNNREIARLLNKSESAVGSALHRLMKKLRAQWNETK